MLKNFIVLELLVVLSGLICGCSQPNQGAPNSNPADLTPEMSKELRLEKFDRLLSQISNEAAARLAVDAFTDYAESRLVEGQITLTETDRQTIAQKENLLRNPLTGGGQMAMRAANGHCLRVEQVVNIFSSLSTNQTVSLEGAMLWVMEKTRANLPHLSIYQDERVGPLEALVFSYTFYTGDAGGAKPRSVLLGAKKEQIESFIHQVIE